jgi:hypothetical protein
MYGLAVRDRTARIHDIRFCHLNPEDDIYDPVTTTFTISQLLKLNFALFISIKITIYLYFKV